MSPMELGTLLDLNICIIVGNVIGNVINTDKSVLTPSLNVLSLVS